MTNCTPLHPKRQARLSQRSVPIGHTEPGPDQPSLRRDHRRWPRAPEFRAIAKGGAPTIGDTKPPIRHERKQPCARAHRSGCPPCSPRKGELLGWTRRCSSTSEKSARRAAGSVRAVTRTRSGCGFPLGCRPRGNSSAVRASTLPVSRSLLRGSSRPAPLSASTVACWTPPARISRKRSSRALDRPKQHDGMLIRTDPPHCYPCQARPRQARRRSRSERRATASAPAVPGVEIPPARGW